MTDKTPTKRRSVSKARLYKELEATINTHALEYEDNIGKLMETLKDEIVSEALGK